jgi:porphobilinogen synthase
MTTKTAARTRAAKTKTAKTEQSAVALPAPISRLRRLRRTRRLRNLIAETRVTAEQLIMPHFVLPEKRANEPISAMPGIAQQGIETVVKTIGKDLELGIRAVLLFGHPEHGGKTPDGRAAAAANGAVQRTCERLKKEFADELVVITDVCLCAYTDHGHCGVLDAHGRVLNDESLRPLVDMALSHARAGADVVAPSDMMDGRVLAIRTALDRAGFEETGLLSYAVKFASGYYGPFREAADSRPAQGDRRSYQMDSRNGREAVREALVDVEEGADWLMVKPALPYLDVIRAVREASLLPLSAYNVSGEYSAVKAAAANGWLDEPTIVRENLTAIARAGADQIITYHARDALKGAWL